MIRPANVEIRAKHYTSPGQPAEEMLTRASGQCGRRGGALYILYEEKSADTPAVTRCRLKLEEGRLTMLRRGDSGGEMVFIPGKKTLSRYQTPYGELELMIRTDILDMREEEDAVRVGLRYVLEAEGAAVSEAELEIRVQMCAETD